MNQRGQAVRPCIHAVAVISLVAVGAATVVPTGVVAQTPVGVQILSASQEWSGAALTDEPTPEVLAPVVAVSGHGDDPCWANVVSAIHVGHPGAVQRVTARQTVQVQQDGRQSSTVCETSNSP